MVTEQGTTMCSNTDNGDQKTLAEMRVTMNELYRFNRTLKVNVITLQERHHKDFQVKDAILDHQLLSYEIWDAPVIENFKPPTMVKFDGKSNPEEHIVAINTKMVTICTSNSLKCKLLSDTSKEEA